MRVSHGSARGVWYGGVPAALLVVAAILLAYAGSLDASFQFDDFSVVVQDPRVQSPGAWWHSLPAIRPLLRLSYALNHGSGAGVRGFRAVNILIHCGNALLVLALLRRLGRHVGLAPAPALVAALVAALCFALHPVQTEAVTYISGRSSSLLGLCALGAMWLWLRSADGSAVSDVPAAPAPAAAIAAAPARAAPWLRAGSILLASAAFAVKESAIAIVPAMLLVSAMVATDPRVPGLAARLRRSLVPHALAAAASMALLWAVTPYPRLLHASLAQTAPAHNLLNQANALPYLLGHLVSFGALNADPDLAPVTALDAATGLRLALLAGAVLWALAGLRRAPVPAFAVLWCALWLLPTHSLLARAELANDRQLYLALIGPAWLAGWALAVAAARWQPPRSRPAVARAARASTAVAIAALALLLGTATVARNRVYATEISYWEDAARRSPLKARPATNLGYAYALACRDDEARSEFARALRLEPADSHARINLALLQRHALFAPGSRACEPPAPTR